MLAITYKPAITLHIHTQGRVNNAAGLSLYRIMVTATSVLDVMNIINIVPRIGIERTFLAFWASLLTNTPSRHLDVTMLPTPVSLSSALSSADQYTMAELNCPPPD